MAVKIGAQFHYSHADANPLWTVVENRGRGMWIAEIKEDPDWQGQKKAFSSEEIEGCLKLELFWKDLTNGSDAFFAQLTPGSVVHYHSGHGSFVRCKVTDGRQLLPIALVGEWSKHDLPRYMNTGEVYPGYHVKQIQEQKTFRPNASNIYEFKPGNHKVDPTNLPVINTTLPPLAQEQQDKAAQYRKLETIQHLVKQHLEPEVIFEQLKSILRV